MFCRWIVLMYLSRVAGGAQNVRHQEARGHPRIQISLTWRGLCGIVFSTNHSPARGAQLPTFHSRKRASTANNNVGGNTKTQKPTQPHPQRGCTLPFFLPFLLFVILLWIVPVHLWLLPQTHARLRPISMAYRQCLDFQVAQRYRPICGAGVIGERA